MPNNAPQPPVPSPDGGDPTDLNTAAGVDQDANAQLLVELRSNFEAVHNRVRAIQLEPAAMREVTKSLDPLRLTVDPTSEGIYAPLLGRVVTGSPVLLKLGAAQVLSRAAAGDQALSPELAALAGALYFYVRLTDYDRMVASAISTYYMLKRPNQLDESIDHIKKVYAGMAQEPNSAFKALLTGELDDTNRLGETKFLAGMLQPLLGLLHDKGESVLTSVRALWTKRVSDHLKDLSVGYDMKPVVEELMNQWRALPVRARATLAAPLRSPAQQLQPSPAVQSIVLPPVPTPPPVVAAPRVPPPVVPLPRILPTPRPVIPTGPPTGFGLDTEDFHTAPSISQSTPSQSWDPPPGGIGGLIDEDSEVVAPPKPPPEPVLPPPPPPKIEVTPPKPGGFL